MRQRNPDKGLGLSFAKGAMAFEIAIETGRRRGDKNVERLTGGGQGLRNRACGWQGLVHRRGKHRAGVDFNDLMRARLHESGGWPDADPIATTVRIMMATRTEREPPREFRQGYVIGLDRRSWYAANIHAVQPRVHVGGSELGDGYRIL
jgi:hypothetical protein